MDQGTAARRASVGEGGDSSAKETISDFTENIKDKASDAGQRMSDKFEQQRGNAASGLSSAASTLHEAAERLPGERVKAMAHGAAESMERGSEYIRQHDVSEMSDDVIQIVKKYPGQAILASLAVGFLVGRMFTRGD